MNQHPNGCRCDKCRQRCCQVPRDAFLMQRIVGTGQEWCRRVCETLQLSGLPDCAQPPFCLVSVEASGTAVITDRLPDRCQRNQAVYRVEIPLTAQVRDARNCTYTACAILSVEARVMMSQRVDECCLTQVVACAAVRLVSCPPPSNCPCFEAAMDVRLEIYVVKNEACRRGCSCEPPPCPDLPLYPHMPMNHY